MTGWNRLKLYQVSCIVFWLAELCHVLVEDWNVLVMTTSALNAQTGCKKESLQGRDTRRPKITLKKAFWGVFQFDVSIFLHHFFKSFRPNFLLWIRFVQPLCNSPSTKICQNENSSDQHFRRHVISIMGGKYVFWNTFFRVKFISLPAFRIMQLSTSKLLNSHSNHWERIRGPIMKKHYCEIA